MTFVKVCAAESKGMEWRKIGRDKETYNVTRSICKVFRLSATLGATQG